MNNLIDRIDAYLDGTLSAEDKAQFEAQLANDESLRQQLEVQQNLRAGIDRIGMKAATTSAFRKITLKNKIYKWGMATVVTGAVVAGSYMLVNQSSSETEGANITYTLPATNEDGGTEWADADRNLPTQLFTINPTRDTVIETMNGLIFAIPADAFLYAYEPITVEIREAVTAFDIMKAGLSTTSNGELLETGGMFYINARSGDHSLTMNPDKPICANIPTNEIRPGMQLFEGERKPDGSINWINPKPLEKQLIPVNIFALNFYPKGFLEKVAELGFDANNRKVTDSIYYSYAGRRSNPIQMIWSEDYVYARDREIVSMLLMQGQDTGTYETRRQMLPEMIYPNLDTTSYYYEIDPARISAIRTKEFQNTLIASKEFEERLQVIFSLGMHEILDLYVNNLDKKLYQIDSMAMNIIEGNQFREFYERHDGGVSVSQSHMRKLQEYYQKKQEAVRIASQKTFDNRTDEQRKQDSIYLDSQNEYYRKGAKQSGENFAKEFDINLKEAYRQLGMPFTKAPAPYYYSFQVQTPGWLNVDAYVLQATAARTTLDYTDPTTGKKAVIKYEELKINIADEANYSQLMVYLLGDQLPCFQKAYSSPDGYKINLNELVEYSLVVIGEKDGTWFSAITPKVTPGTVNVTLQGTDEQTLRSTLSFTFGNKVGADFATEVSYMKETHQYNVRKEKEAKQAEIDRQIMEVIFPYVYWDINYEGLPPM